MRIDRRLAGALAFWLTRPVRGRLGLSYVYHYDLRGPVTPFRADLPVEIYRATMSDVEEAALLPAPRDRERFNGRLDNGNACFVAKADGRVVAFNWTWFSPGSDDGCTVVLGPGEIHTTNAFTAPGYRGRKIHTETLAYMLHAAKVEGYRDAYTQVSVLNRASEKRWTGSVGVFRTSRPPPRPPLCELRSAGVQRVAPTARRSRLRRAARA